MKRIIICAAVLCTVMTMVAQSSIDALRKAQEIVSAVKAEYAPDKRQTVYTIEAFNNTDGLIVIAGETSDSIAANVIAARMTEAAIDYADSVIILPYDCRAQVRLSVASLRTDGRHAAEMATQALMGTPLRVLNKDAEWWRVQMPDGYIAWVPSSSVIEKTIDEMDAWKQSRRYIVSSLEQVKAYKNSTDKTPRNVLTDLVTGCIVASPSSAPHVENGMLEIELPDGRKGYALASAFTPIEEWAAQDFNPDLILDTAYSLEGTPYLWGGTSIKSLDCSGLAKVSYFANGIILMRDASQQATTGQRIEAKDWRRCRAGDLLFFGNAKTGRVTHVAIYDNNGNYVHSSGRVKRNSVDPESPSYLTTPFLHAVRIHGNEETRGITRARNHPWYF